MKRFVLRNERSGQILAPRLQCAGNALQRCAGLLPQKSLAADEGLWLGGCNAVHTLGMRAIIDLYFLDRDDRVVKIACAVPPNRLAACCRTAKTVVELGTAHGSRDVVLGDRLRLE